MAAIRNFFKKKKLDIKFSAAGTGHKLNDTETKKVSIVPANDTAQRLEPSHSAQRAAEAALARCETKGRPQPVKSKPFGHAEIEEARKCIAEAEKLKEKFTEKKEVEVEKPSVLSGVYFECPLFENLHLPRDEMGRAIRDYLLEELPDNPAEVSALIIHTFAKSKDILTKCLETINKLLDNIMSHPEDPKYRRVRLGNPRFAQDVVSVEGSVEFLKACGFHEEHCPVANPSAESGSTEAFLVMPPEMPEDTNHLANMKRILADAEPILPTLYRDTKVFVACGNVAQLSSKITLPDEFYAISEAEIRREQELQQRAVEESGMLLTKAMRERMHSRELRRYRYALIRVRFPDNIILQGTFHAKSTLSEVLEWLKECLEFHWIPYYLTHSLGGRLTDTELSLAELKLAPSSLVNFSFDQAALSEFTGTQNAKIQFINDSLLANALPL